MNGEQGCIRFGTLSNCVMKTFIALVFLLLSFSGFSQTITDITYQGKDSIQTPDVGKNNKTSDVFEITEVMPEFPGGEKAMMAFISKNLKYPSGAIDKNIQGRVLVQFVVDKDGSINSISTINKPPIGYGVEEAAMDVIRRMPKWKPGTQRGVPVAVRFRIPIMFRIK